MEQGQVIVIAAIVAAVGIMVGTRLWLVFRR